jgi:hypothetical protein
MKIRNLELFKVPPRWLFLKITSEDGYVDIPSGAGLGIEINEEAVREAAKKGHDWKNPLWRLANGSVAEWEALVCADR